MATRDFRSQQIRTTQIIASGSDTTSKPSLLIYSASAATNDQGSINANLLSGAGEDAWLFISGSTNTADGQQVLFGGNVAISGSISGSIFASLPSGDLTFNSDDDIIFNSAGSEFFQIKNDTPQSEVVVNDSANDIDFRVETENMQSAIHVNAAQDLVVIGRDAAPGDLSAGSSPAVGTDVKVLIDGTANSKDGSTRGSTLVAGDLVVSGTLYAERQVMEVDLSQSGSLVLSSSLHFDDIGAAPGDSGQTTIAVPINDGALFVATGSLRFRTTTNGTDFIETNVGAQYVAGNGIESTTVGSTTTFETDDTIVAHLTGSEFNGHVGITGSLAVDGDMSLTANSVLRFNNPGQNDQTITGNDSTITLDADDALNMYADSNINILAGNANENQLNIQSSKYRFNLSKRDVDLEVNTDDYYATLLVDGGDNSIILGHEGFNSDASASEADGYGDDIKIMLSGSAGSKDGATRGVVSVPGDMVVSGTLYYADDSSSESYLSSPGNGLSRDINSNNRTIELSLNDISGSVAITSSDSFAFIDADDSATKKATVGQLSTAIAGNGLTQSSNQLNVNVDDSTIQIDSDTLKVKNYGIGSLQLKASVAGDGLNGAGGLALSVDTGNGLKIGSSSDVITDDAVVAHLSGSEFNGHVGITGSLAVTSGDVSLTATSRIRLNNPGENDQYIYGNNSTVYVDGDNFVQLNSDQGVQTNANFAQNKLYSFYNDLNSQRQDVDLYVNTDDYYATVLVDANDNSVILGHEGFGALPSASDADGYGDDVKIMLSGSAGSKDGSTRGVVLVPGDLVISGTLYDGDGSRINLFSYDENGTFATPSSATGTNSVAIGNKAVASGNNSIALGTSETNTTEATGLHAAALGGDDATASGDYSTVLGGYGNTASGDYSVAIGRSSEAKGENSIAIGVSLVAGENDSIAIGNSTNTTKIALSGSVEAFGDVNVPEYIYHSGDSDTYLRFQDNAIGLSAGGQSIFEKLSGENTISINNDSSSLSTIISTSNKLAFSAKDSTDQVLILSGGNETSFDQAAALDVAFYVSGSTDSKGTAVRGLSLFGGDVHISGSLSGPDEYTLTDSTVRIFRDGSTMKFDDGENVVKTLSELASIGASTDFFVGVHGANASTAKLKATGSVAFSGDSDNFVDGLQSEGVGQDVFVFFSGSIGSKDGTTRGVTLFGGDTVFSGSTGFTNVAAANNIVATGSLIAGGNVIKNSNGDKNIVFDSSNPYNLFADASIVNSISAQSNVHIEKDSNTQASTSNTLSDFGLVLRNDSTQTNAFAGIAFDVSTETDADSIGAAIRAERDTSAGSTAANHDSNITFATNDAGDGGLTERMRITHDGNVGIGLTNPLDSLHTSGDIRVGGNVIRASDGGSTITMDTSDNVTVGGNITAGSGNFYAASGQTLTLNSPHHVIVKLDTDNNGAAEFQIDNGTGTEVFVVDESGNLQIDGDLTVSGNDIKDSGGNTVFTFDGSGNVSNAVDFSSGVTVAGNLAIADRLQHIGDTNTQIRFLANNKISMETSSGGLFLIDAASAQKEVVINEVGADVDFRVESDNSLYALFVQGSSRNVGIGNNNPSYPLDVTGDIRLSGDLRVDGNNIIGTALELDSTSNITLDATGDIILSADGDQIRMNDGTTERFTFNVDSTPELDVTGNFILDGSGTIELDAVGNITLDSGGDIYLDADGGQVYFRDAGTNYMQFNVNGSTDSITVTGALTLDASSNITLDADGGTITFADNGVSLGTITSAGYSGNAATATSADTIDTTATSTNSDHYVTFVDSSSSTSGETLRVDSGLVYNPSSNNLTVNGHLEVVNGIKKSTSTKVASYSTSTNQWVKIASATDIDYDDSLNTVFLIILTGYDISTSYAIDATFEVNVKFNGDNASPYYNEEGTYITVDATNADNLIGFDPTTDIAITFDNTSTPTQVDLYIKSIENYKDAFVSIIGGTNVNGNTVDPGFELLTGQSYAASITSLGQEVYGTWASKVFNSLTAESASLPGSTIGITVSNPSSFGLYSVTTTEDYISDNSPSTGKARVTFVAPASGNVEINYQSGILIQDNNAATLYLGLSTNGTTFGSGDVTGTQNTVYDADTNRSGARVTIHHKWVLTGLTAGSSYTYYIGAYSDNSTTFDIVWGGSGADLYYPPLIVEARALPSITTM